MKIFAKSSLIVALILLFTSSDLTAQLARQWVARFNGGLKKKSNGATAMAIDKSGDVIVVGWVTNSGTGVDMAIVKYKSDGTFVKAVTYDGTGTGDDKAVAVAVDTGKNIYVTGYASVTGEGLNYVTLKYDSSLNTKLWEKPYNGSGGDDKPVAIAVNDSLNVFVTGTSSESGTGRDYTTIKYDAAGAVQWTQHYNGPISGTDSAFAMALRGNTDLFVTGTSRDSIIGGGAISYDYATVRYNAATGDTIWTARYHGDRDDIARALVLRSTNEVYVTGSSRTDTTGWDYLTVRYDYATGVEDWTSRYNDPANGDDNAYAISLQSTTRVYVTGRALGIGTFNDIVTARYNQSNGNEQWVSSYNGPANDDDGGVAIGSGNNPYVLGPSMGAGTRQDFALVQYNGSNGNQNSANRYNGSFNYDDVPSALATASGGAVYVTGYSAPADKGTDMLTIKYVDQSDVHYRTFSQTDYMTTAVNLKSGDPNAGNVRDEGFTRAYPKIKKGFPGYPGGMVIGQARPDSNTSYGWMRFDKGKNIIKFFPQTAATTVGFELLLDGKPFLGEKKNLKLTKYNSHLVGEMVALRLNIGASDAEVTPPTLGDLTYDDGDTSNHYNGMTLRQIASTIDNYLTYWKKYPPANWALFDTIVSRCNRAFIGSTSPLAWVSRSPLEVTGVNPVDSVFYLQSAIAPLADPLAFPEGSLDTEVPKMYTLSQNYPNPFNPTTTIAFELPEQAIVSLKVYDILGREVATLLDQQDVSEGVHEVEFAATSLASGVYFYRVIAYDTQLEHVQFQQIKKMLMVK
jgi:hypothetical protein